VRISPPGFTFLKVFYHCLFSFLIFFGPGCSACVLGALTAVYSFPLEGSYESYDPLCPLPMSFSSKLPGKKSALLLQRTLPTCQKDPLAKAENGN
jgi:hypothetical protein